MAGEKTGCFSWCVRLKEACSERWARFINRLRRRFYARRGQTVDPDSVLNETGTKDMVLSKTPRISYIVIPDILADSNDKDCQLNVGTVTDNDLNRQVEEYVTRIIQTAADTFLSNSKRIITDADDNISLTPSIISQIADRAVTDSLTHIVIENDSNQSVIRENKPKPIVEFTEKLESAADDKDDVAEFQPVQA